MFLWCFKRNEHSFSSLFCCLERFCFNDIKNINIPAWEFYFSWRRHHVYSHSDDIHNNIITCDFIKITIERRTDHFKKMFIQLVVFFCLFFLEGNCHWEFNPNLMTQTIWVSHSQNKGEDFRHGAYSTWWKMSHSMEKMVEIFADCLCFIFFLSFIRSYPPQSVHVLDSFCFTL